MPHRKIMFFPVENQNVWSSTYSSEDHGGLRVGADVWKIGILMFFHSKKWIFCVFKLFGELKPSLQFISDLFCSISKRSQIVSEISNISIFPTSESEIGLRLHLGLLLEPSVSFWAALSSKQPVGAPKSPSNHRIQFPSIPEQPWSRFLTFSLGARAWSKTSAPMSGRLVSRSNFEHCKFGKSTIFKLQLQKILRQSGSRLQNLIFEYKVASPTNSLWLIWGQNNSVRGWFGWISPDRRKSPPLHPICCEKSNFPYVRDRCSQIPEQGAELRTTFFVKIP